MTLEATYASQAVCYWTNEVYKLKNKEEILRACNDEVLRPKIQRVPAYMRTRMEFETFYLPKLVSVGPTHFAKPYVELGVPYKLMWTAMCLADTNQTFDDLFNRIAQHFEELEELFVPKCWASLDDLKGWTEQNIWTSCCSREEKNYIYQAVLTVDGCSILHVLDKSVHSDDPEKELKVSIEQLVQVHQDLLLLENQIPYKVLKLLCKDDEARLNRCMRNFLQIHGIVKQEKTSTVGKASPEHNVRVQVEVDDEDEDEDEDDDPVHLLDYLRRALLMRDLDQIHKEIKLNCKSMHLRKYRIGTIRELKAAGIRIRKDRNKTGFLPRFNAGQLLLPEITVDGSTAITFLNLIAYEMCPDFHNNFEISSYVVFLSSLIDQPEDVKELRKTGILHNELASDKEVADLFNRMDTVLVPETARFAHISDLIQDHIESRRARIKVLGWMREAYDTHFRTPWSVIALMAATLGLALAFLQTWFTMHPS